MFIKTDKLNNKIILGNILDQSSHYFFSSAFSSQKEKTSKEKTKGKGRSVGREGRWLEGAEGREGKREGGSKGESENNGGEVEEVKIGRAAEEAQATPERFLVPLTR